MARFSGCRGGARAMTDKTAERESWHPCSILLVPPAGRSYRSSLDTVRRMCIVTKRGFRVRSVHRGQHGQAGFGPIPFPLRRVLAILAALWLVGAPVQHALAHAASDWDHDATDPSAACVVCRVLSASPGLDASSPMVGTEPAPPSAFDEAVLPTHPPAQAESHPTDLARAPPPFARLPVARTGRLRST